MKDFGQASGGNALSLQGPTQRQLITLGLDLDAEFITSERNAGLDSIVELLLIFLGNLQGLALDFHERLGISQIIIALRGGERGILALRFEALIGRSHELAGRKGFVNGVT